MSIFEHFQARYEAAKDEELSIQDFLALCKENKSAYMPMPRSACCWLSANPR